MKFIKIALLVLAIAVLGGAGTVILRFQDDMAATRERLGRGSKVIATRCGPIEYSDAGEGPAVLVLHGAGGGHDQGILLGRLLVGKGYRIIAPSRPGFLRTPLAQNGTFPAQADAFACLLDSLGIARAAVVGISAGGPSAVQFSVRHPKRTTALVLVSSVVHREKPMDFRDRIIHQVLLRSDFFFWLTANYFERDLIAFLGVPPAVQKELGPADRAWLTQELVPFHHPISLRRAGMANDRQQFTGIIDNLGRITAPALVIYAEDDTLVTTSHSLAAVKSIPKAKALSFKTGGHLLLGHAEEINSRVRKFLESAKGR